jgi:hypothetical protein
VPLLFACNVVSRAAQRRKLIALISRERGGELPLIIQAQLFFGPDPQVTKVQAVGLMEKFNFQNI